MITTIDFLRHGETAGGSYYRGSTDDPLSELGWQQMNSAVAGQHWDHIISSPLHRCLDFARLLSIQTNTTLSVDTNWQEINFGDWEGKTAEQINSADLIKFYQDPVNNSPKNAENYLTFQSRINHSWKNLSILYPEQHILVITHAGVIRSLFPLLLDLPIPNIFKIQIDHASISRFQCYLNHNNNFNSLIFLNNKKPLSI